MRVGSISYLMPVLWQSNLKWSCTTKKSPNRIMSPFNPDNESMIMPTARQLQGSFSFVVHEIIRDPQAATAANYGQFFIAPFDCAVVRVDEVHSTAGTNGGAVTLDVEKLTGTTAEGSGVSVLASTFNLKSTANTVVNKFPSTSVTSNVPNKQLAKGDRLALLTSGTLTAVNNVVVVVILKARWNVVPR